MRSNLERHKKNVHERLREFECGECDKAYAQFQVLKHHMAAVHSGLKPFLCSGCPYRASSGGNLKDHVTRWH